MLLLPRKHICYLRAWQLWSISAHAISLNMAMPIMLRYLSALHCCKTCISTPVCVVRYADRGTRMCDKSTNGVQAVGRSWADFNLGIAAIGHVRCNI
ncbi:hypothetical protein GGR51DRAFT_77157 [Nemania sp. FL0031]|nr:hypothetical protein GGR51DRAFT_77157 [Nemania sp. FL0031]